MRCCVKKTSEFSQTLRAERHKRGVCLGSLEVALLTGICLKLLRRKTQ